MNGNMFVPVAATCDAQPIVKQAPYVTLLTNLRRKISRSISNGSNLKANERTCISGSGHGRRGVNPSAKSSVIHDRELYTRYRAL
jgi:hypothetical protein